MRDIPDTWGPKYEASGIGIAHTHTGPNEIKYTPAYHSALVLITPQPEREVAVGSDRRRIGIAPAGSLEIFPKNADVFARWRQWKQSVFVTMDTDRLARLAGKEFDREDFEFLPPQFGKIDRFTLFLADAMRHELGQSPFVFKESFDALTIVFFTHLLRSHSSLSRYSSPALNGGLPPLLWKRVNDYIQANIAETLTLDKLADVCKLSPSHFARAFRKTTGQTPHRYVVSSRLIRAGELIRKTDTPLHDIATKTGFSSQSHMTSVMRKQWGTTPAEHRREDW
ncbi:helix-turn-helix transcriptional regulator [Brucella intermedia]|nr:helix-turn-helix transcriptional regulator [Brucella intermedia]